MMMHITPNRFVPTLALSLALLASCSSIYDSEDTDTAAKAAAGADTMPMSFFPDQ